MKRTNLKKKSNSDFRKFLDLADRALQDWYRWKFWGTKCENCGIPFNVVHHHREKHSSSGLRFENSNLIFLCFGCHTSLHFGNTKVSDTYIKKRGMAWLKKLMKLELDTKGIVNTIQRAQEMIKKYELK